MTIKPTEQHLFDGFDAATAGLVAIQIALAFEVARNGPLGPIAVHFDIHGTPNGWGDRNIVAMLIAGVAVLTLLANVIIGFTIGRRPAEGATRRTASILRGGAIALGAVITLIFAALALTPSGVDATGRQRLIMSCAWLILIGTGAVAGKLAPNPYLGVRVYWTFRSRLAWDKANRLLGRIYFLGGLIGLLATPFVDLGAGMAWMIGWIVAVGGGGAALAIIESWRVWRADPEKTA